jgi:transposase
VTPAIWAEIHRLRELEHLSLRAIERRLRIGRRTIKKALALETPPLKEDRPARSILDPFHDSIDALVEKYPHLSAVRVLEELHKLGYRGEVSLVRRYLRQIRPIAGRLYHELEHPPGRDLQVDWGDCGTIAVGDTTRRLSVFVAVLCHSRMSFIKFTLSQTKEAFYRAIVEALEFFGGTPARIIFDNLKAAVLAGYGRSARLHPEFAALCGHYRMEPIACDRADPESKGSVEAAVRYVKRNALAGRQEALATFEDYQRLAVSWRDTVANVRLHATTAERPVDRFANERARLRPLPPTPFDTDEVRSVVVTSYARVQFDTNRYSMPPEYFRKPVVLRADDSILRVFAGGKEIARHRRSQLRQFELEFDALGPEAQAFRQGLAQVPVKPLVHLRRILALVGLYGKAEVLAAITVAAQYQVFDAAYISNLIDQARRRRHAPSPIPLTPRRRELLEEGDLDEPDPAHYDSLLGEEV